MLHFCIYLQTCKNDGASRKTSFRSKMVEHDITLTSFLADLSEPLKRKRLVTMFKMDSRELQRVKKRHHKDINKEISIAKNRG